MMENLERKPEGSWIASILPFSPKTEHKLKDRTVYVFWASTGKFLSLEKEIAGKETGEVKTYIGICHEHIHKGEEVILWYDQSGRPGIVKACDKDLEFAIYNLYFNTLNIRL